jgi:hypothetical protein
MSIPCFLLLIVLLVSWSTLLGMVFVIYYLYPSKAVLPRTLRREHICEYFCALPRFPS